MLLRFRDCEGSLNLGTISNYGRIIKEVVGKNFVLEVVGERDGVRCETKTENRFRIAGMGLS